MKIEDWKTILHMVGKNAIEQGQKPMASPGPVEIYLLRTDKQEKFQKWVGPIEPGGNVLRTEN